MYSALSGGGLVGEMRDDTVASELRSYTESILLNLMRELHTASSTTLQVLADVPSLELKTEEQQKS